MSNSTEVNIVQMEDVSKFLISEEEFKKNLDNITDLVKICIPTIFGEIYPELVLVRFRINEREIRLYGILKDKIIENVAKVITCNLLSWNQINADKYLDLSKTKIPITILLKENTRLFFINIQGFYLFKAFNI